MSNRVQRTRSTYRRIRPGPERRRLFFHLLASAILSITFTMALAVAGLISYVTQNIGGFHRFVGSMFALLFTVLAIILAFEEQFKENRAVQQLVHTGHYSKIFRRFYLSVFAVGAIFFLTTITVVFGFYQINILYLIPVVDVEVNVVHHAVSLGVLFGLIATTIRVTSCFMIYYRLDQIIRSLEDN